MIGAIFSLFFLASLCLAIAVAHSALRADGERILAALRGEYMLHPPQRTPASFIRRLARSPQPGVPQPNWRAAA